MRAVVTVVGKDRPGIIARVSTLLYENEINILDISQTVMTDDIFTMIMLVDMRSSSVGEVGEKLLKLSDEIGMSIHLQNEELFNSMHRI
ncbi:MAG: ACT domain-containing protein [Eubacteriales bacterium]|nr:ACT domain-containing protein [Eubacteriales bacterium]